MKAAKLTKQGEPLEIVEIDCPKPGTGELLVKLEACGICHTDLHIRDGDDELPQSVLPLTLGHEGIGIVHSVGEGVVDFSIGDRVGIPWLHDTCQNCRDCLTGHESICSEQRAHGMQVNGGFAEFVISKADFTISIPDQLDPISAAPLLCAGVTAFGAVRKAAIEPGELCTILGCGGLGQYAIQLAKIKGAIVAAVDTDSGRLDVATELGADICLKSDSNTGRRLREQGGIDACINFAPTPAIWGMVEEALNNRGRFVSVAMPKEPVPLSLTWLTYLTPIITGTSVGGRQELRDFISLAAQHNLKIPIETVSLQEANASLDRLAGKPSGKPVRGRLVIDFGDKLS